MRSAAVGSRISLNLADYEATSHHFFSLNILKDVRAGKCTAMATMGIETNVHHTVSIVIKTDIPVPP